MREAQSGDGGREGDDEAEFEGWTLSKKYLHFPLRPDLRGRRDKDEIQGTSTYRSMVQVQGHWLWHFLDMSSQAMMVMGCRR